MFPHNFVQGVILVLRNMLSGRESSLLAAPGRATPSPYLPCPLLQVSSQQSSISFLGEIFGNFHRDHRSLVVHLRSTITEQHFPLDLMPAAVLVQ